MRGDRRSSVFALILLAAAMLAPDASARVKRSVVHFEIDRQNAAAALNMLAEQAGAPILFPYDSVKSIEANALHGDFTLEAALPVLLAGTGLKGSVSERGAIIVSHGDINTREDMGVLKRTSFLGTVSALAASAFLPQGANAQSGEPAASNIDTITVTARRREENLQDTPVSVSAFTDESLERQQIQGTEDLDMVTPNLQFTSYGPLTGNNSAAQVFIRGIGQTDATAAVDPGVGIYMDDVYLGRAVGGAMEFRDIANVQILRGPQGTLFGRNTIGGAVLLTTTDPGDDFGVTLRARTGTDDLIELFGAVDLPVSETLGARVSGGMRKRDGYVTRSIDGLDLGDDDTYGFNGKVRWEPTSAFNIVLKADYAHEDENGSPFVFNTINEAAVFPIAVSVGAGCPGAVFPPPIPVPMIDDPRCANDFYFQGPFVNGGNAPVESKLESWGASGHIEWQASEALTLKSITAYRELEWSGVRDADNTPFDILTTDLRSDSKQFSEELQVLVDIGRLNGVVGGYYFDEDTFDITRVVFSPPNPTVLAGGPGSLDVQDVDLGTKSYAFFTQWSFDVTDALSVGGGLRYTDEEKTLQATIFNLANATAPIPDPRPTLATTEGGPLFIFPRPFSEDFSSVIGSASIQYRWSPSLLTYFNWSQGFKSGGFNERYNAPTVDLSTGIVNNLPISFAEETANTYEIGFKSDIAGVLRLNAAGFRTKYDDIQLIYRLGIVPLLFNAGTATISGFEAELTYAPNADFIIDASVGHLIDRFKDIVAVPLTTATVGPNNALPFTPSWSGHIGAAYTLRPFGGGVELSPRVNLAITSSQFFDAANTVEVAQNDTVVVLNTSVRLADPDRGWALVVGLNNATDELYPVAGNASLSTSTGYAESIYARPRNWFVELSVDF